MSTYIEIPAIFILCTFLCQPKGISSLMLVLSAFIVVCFSISLKSERLQLGLLVISFFSCIFVPDFTYFLPAILYMSVFRRKHVYPIVGAFSIIFIIYYEKCESLSEFLLLLTLFLLSCHLAEKSREKQELQTTILRLRDNSVEQEMILNRKNEQLLLSQNEEIFVATLKERNRIAREIHDNVGHTLSRSILQVGALLAITKDETIKGHLDSLKESLDDAMNNIRNSVHDLHDESVDLKSSLQNLVDGFTFCPITFSCEMSRNVPKDIKYCFIAITKEALNNIIKHSNATRVTVTVKEHPGLYQLLIEDNGTGGSSAKDGSGIGLSNMKERAAALNGNIHITAEHGFRIFLSVPKKFD